MSTVNIILVLFTAASLLAICIGVLTFPVDPTSGLHDILLLLGTFGISIGVTALVWYNQETVFPILVVVGKVVGVIAAIAFVIGCIVAMSYSGD